MCIIFYVLGVSMLTLHTYSVIHSVQKPFVSQQLPLAMEQAGANASPTANTSQWQTIGFC